MADEKSKLIDIEGLQVFKAEYDTLVDEKIAEAGQGVTYTLTKSGNTITLTGSDGTTNNVTDANTTYGFSQSGTTLTITPSVGDPITITLGEEITAEKITTALGFTPADENDIPNVPSWAMATSKPTYTASEVGADASGSADTALSSAKDYTDTKIADLINGAPSTLDTLKEIADAMEAEQSVVEALEQSIGNKVDKVEGKGLSTNDFTASYKNAIDNLPSSYAPTDAQANVIETIKVNNSAITPTNKAVNITVPTKASDIGALPDTTVIPAEVTETTVSGWGFTKNTGTYSKPTGGIPKSDLSSAVQTSLGKADTALQSFTETDPTVPSHVKSITSANISSWNAKAETSDIPTKISDLSDDSTHRVVTDTEKSSWNAKSDFSGYFIGTESAFNTAKTNGYNEQLAFITY